MQYDVSSPQAYIDVLEMDWRKDKLLQIRNLILQQDASVVESVNYKMLYYSLNGVGVFHLNAQKHYVSLYCGDVKKIDPSGELLTGFNLGKGCIRLSKTTDIASSGLPAFIGRGVQLVKQGVDISC